jgi:sulfur carrier protein
MSLTVLLNGQNECLESLEEGVSLEAVINGLGLKADRVAVEHNGEIVPRSRWAGCQVRDGERLEVVHFVGGGTT